jgi:choline/glycine/proline betaine transport protein
MQKLMDDWKEALASLFKNLEEQRREDTAAIERNRREAYQFFSSTVLPAFAELRAEIERYARIVKVESSPEGASVSVHKDGVREIQYDIKARVSPRKIDVLTIVDGKEGVLKGSEDRSSIAQISKEEIIEDFLEQYEPRVWRLWSLR